MENNVKIKVFGVGGGGCNTVDYVSNHNDVNVFTVALNTDDQALVNSKADKKIRLGKNLTRGLGAGAIPEIGRRAALESIEDIKELLNNTDVIFITAGMGGGTGTGAAPEVARIAKEMGILTISIATTPFEFEGFGRMELAINGLAELRKNSDVCIYIPNQNLIKNYGEKYIEDAFLIPDDILYTSIMSIIRSLSVDSRFSKSYNLNGIKDLFKDAGLALMSIESSLSPDATQEENLATAFNKIFESDMLDFSVNGAQKFVIIIKCNPNTPQSLILERVAEIVTQYLGYTPERGIDVIPEFDESIGDGFEVVLLATRFKEENTENRILQNNYDRFDNSIFSESIK